CSLRSRCSNSRERGEKRVIALSRVRLPRHAVEPLEAHLQRDSLAELFHLRVIALEQLEEAGFSSCGSTNPAETQRAQAMFDFLEVEHEVLQPERCALADRSWLRGLQVCEAERRQIAVLACEVGK